LDPLVNALNTIMSHEQRRKSECIITPASGLVGRVLRLIQSKGYVGEIEFIDDGRQGKFRVQLFGRINECQAVTTLQDQGLRDGEVGEAVPAQPKPWSRDPQHPQRGHGSQSG